MVLNDVAGGALFAEEFAHAFEIARGINTALMEGGAQEDEEPRQLGLKANGSKTSVSSESAFCS